MDWIGKSAIEILDHSNPTIDHIRRVIVRNMPEPPLLQCPDCYNTESCAGAMAREFNRGRCLFCGGFFKVVRA